MFFWQNHIVGAELLRLWRATTGFALLEARQALSGGSLTVPDIPEKWWHGFTPLPSLLVCVRVRSCAYICVLEKRKWRRQIPPKKVKPEHAVVVAMLIIYFFKLFFYLPLFYLLSLISVVRFICICLLFTVVFVRSPFCCFCVGVCLPLISLSFYSQNSS